ncbi:YqjF family protein [Arthrobacter sp. NPDC056886]|uniref:YqjF family protein n=1 Tax=Arthrobacter sp. NPDC056886 TaxID=3345960 RepID=UPI00366E1AFE
MRLGVDPWPEAPRLPAPIVMEQHWLDAVFLHWRIPEAASASFMPPGVAPDVFDGSAWVGLIGFRMQRAGLGRGPGVPYFGSFNEINVRLYSREPDGTRGVVFRSLDASRLAVVLAARAAGIPYVWSRASFTGTDASHPLRSTACSGRRFRVGTAAGAGASAGKADAAAVGAEGPSTGYSVRRFRGGARSDFAVVPEFDVEATDPLSVHLTARFGLHSRYRGRTLYIPNTHSAWPLYPARLTRFEDRLMPAAGIEITGPPESVLFSPGVRTQFGRPRVLNHTT